MTPRKKTPSTATNIAIALGMFAAAGLALMVISSDDLQSKAYDLPQNGVTAKIVTAAEAWHATMQRAGMARVSAWVKAQLEDARTQRW